MKDRASNITEEPILVTKKPFDFYITIFLLLTLLLSFFIIIHLRQLSREDALSLFIIFLFLQLFVYAYFGQFLAEISLHPKRIEVTYIFPWNKSFAFEFEKIIEFDFRQISLNHSRWYKGGDWLYLKNENQVICNFKYNINNHDSDRLIEEIKKLMDQNLHG